MLDSLGRMEFYKSAPGCEEGETNVIGVKCGHLICNLSSLYRTSLASKSEGNGKQVTSKSCEIAKHLDA